MSKCTYKEGYVDKSDSLARTFDCDEDSFPGRDVCIFHDKENYNEHRNQAIKRFATKVIQSVHENKPLKCIGYYLPSFDFASLLQDEEKYFRQPIFFAKATFYEQANFSKTIFMKEADFSDVVFLKEANFRGATFCGKVDFLSAKFCTDTTFVSANFSKISYFTQARFYGKANFRGAKFGDGAEFIETVFIAKTSFTYSLFEQPNKVTFDKSDLSHVSFADCDITKIRFEDKIIWRGKDGFTIIEEEWIKDKLKGEERNESPYISLELVLSVYRNLRENYEFRLRYDDAGNFFKKEMELKRKYREKKSQNGPTLITKNNWFTRQFSLTGLYYHLSKYGESIKMPTITGIVVLLLSTFFFSMQSNLTLEPTLPLFTSNNSTDPTFIDSKEPQTQHIG